MAYLKDTTINGVLTVTGTVYKEKYKLPTIYKGTSSTQSSNTAQCSSVKFYINESTFKIWAS